METLELVKPGFWKNKKVFVTGHTGFKGTWLSLWLHKMEAVVLGYALNPSTSPSLFEVTGLSKWVHSVIGDIRNYELLHKTMSSFNPDIVIHMAAQPLVRESYSSPVETYSINVMGSVHVLEAIRTVPSVKAVVNVTTDKCYDNKEWHWGYRENEPLGGYDPYSSSKACSELVSSAYRSSFFHPDQYHKHGVALASARAGNVIGGGDWSKDRLLTDVIYALLNDKQIEIRNPDSIRPWQHVLEPLSGYLTLAQSLYLDGAKFAEAWNFGPNDEDAKPVKWIVNEMCKLWGGNASYVISEGDHPHEANYLKLDCSKANIRLGWKPRWELETTLKKIIEWVHGYRDQEDMRQICINQLDDYIYHVEKRGA